MTRFVIAIAALIAAALLPAAAQDWPSRPVRIIIPLGPGGGGDVFTRKLADELQKALGQPFLVENRPGGGLNIGTRACAEAAPDGYTMCMLSSEPLTYNQFLYKSIPYNPDKDLQPIANLFFNVLGIEINSDTKVKSIADMIALAKAKPGTLSYGTFSFPLTHFMTKLNKQEGIDIVRVPFRGGGELVNAVLAGSTPIALLALSNMMPQLQSGRITLLAVNSPARTPLFPDVPTIEEARPGERYPPTWFGIFTPSGVPRPIAEKMVAEMRRIVAQPDFRQRMYVERAVAPAHESLDEFHSFIRAERKIAERIVKDSGEQPK